MVGGCGVATGERNKVFFAVIGIEEGVVVGLVVEADRMGLLGRHMGGGMDLGGQVVWRPQAEPRKRSKSIMDVEERGGQPWTVDWAV